ncbi:MAG TPA: ATP-binding protein, partial [Lysobacter sp.]
QCAPRLSRDRLVLASDLSEPLPALQGDPFLLRQALVNLIENAADFSPPGATIRLRALSDAGRVRFEVDDEGPGVPDYALSRVFERFYSLPRPHGGSRSSGLGLCFVAEVAALHEGRAELHNREAGGARASLEIPAAL